MSTQTKPFSEWTDKKLIDTAKELYCSINTTECYGVSDVLWYDGICNELEKRGYEIKEDSYLNIRKDKEE